jgi:hypothetical protein
VFNKGCSNNTSVIEQEEKRNTHKRELQMMDGACFFFLGWLAVEKP